MRVLLGVLGFFLWNFSAFAADDFTDALVSAYENNPQLKAERESLKATDEDVAVAISGWRPTAIAEYDKGRERTKFGANPRTSGETRDKQLTIEQPLFSGGSTWADYKAARTRVDAGRAKLKSTEQQVLFNAVTAYADVVQAQAVAGLSRNNAEVLAKQMESTQARFEAGELTRTDAALAQARLSQSQADLHQAEGDLAAALATFERVIGYRPGILALPAAPVDIPSSLDEAKEFARINNPDVATAEAIEKASKYDVNSRFGNLLPQVSLFGVATRNEGNNAAGVTRQEADSLTLNVTVPLYQSGAEYARVRAAKDVAQQSRYQAIDTTQAAVELAVRAWEDYSTAASLIRSNTDAIAASETALEGTRAENEFGARTILDVLNAEQELFSSRVNLVRAQRNQTVQAYRLLGAIGRLNAADLQLPTEIYDPQDHYRWIPYKFVGF